MNEEFNVKQLIGLFLPKWPIVLICTLVVGIISFLYSSYAISPTYVAEGTLYITGEVNVVAGSIKQNTNLSDLMLSQELARTYGEILSSNTFFKGIANESGTKYTFSQIQRMTNITNVEDTGLLKISVSHPDPKMAYKLANKILELAPAEISRVVVAGSATIIDPAEMPKAPSSPNIPRNTLIGAIIGCAIAVIVIFMQNWFDNTIKTDEEVQTIFKLPVLGVIPLIEPKSEEG